MTPERDCEDAGVGKNAPDEATTDAFIIECAKRGGISSLSGSTLSDVYAIGGYYAQDFPKGTLLQIGKFFWIETNYFNAYRTEGGPASWLGLPISEVDPSGPPNYYQDEAGHNFTNQPVIYFEKGFIGSNSGSIEAHKYYPQLAPVYVNANIVTLGVITKAELTFGIEVDPAPKDFAGVTLEITVASKDAPSPWTHQYNTGPASVAIDYPYQLPLTSTVNFYLKATRSSDGLIGYAPCTHFTSGAIYQIVPEKAPYTFKFACEGDGGTPPPADTTPPMIHYMDVTPLDNGQV